MFDNVVHAVHVQHAQNMTTCIKITEVQNILLNFIVTLLYFGYYNIIYKKETSKFNTDNFIFNCLYLASGFSWTKLVLTLSSSVAQL